MATQKAPRRRPEPLIEIPAGAPSRREPVVRGKGVPVRTLVSIARKAGLTPKEISELSHSQVTELEVRAALRYADRHPGPVPVKLGASSKAQPAERRAITLDERINGDPNSLIEIASGPGKNGRAYIRGKGVPVRAFIDPWRSGMTSAEISDEWGGHVSEKEVRAGLAFVQEYPELFESDLAD